MARLAAIAACVGGASALNNNLGRTPPMGYNSAGRAPRASSPPRARAGV